MVFPSRACTTCKKRRIKCDQARPSCGRCIKKKCHCVWDTKEDESLVFRSENAFASGRPRRQRREKDQNLGSVPDTLINSLETLCLNFWVEKFTLDPPDNSFALGVEYQSQVVSCWSKARSGSSLRLALSAVAHIGYGRAKQMREAINQAKHTYYQAIQTIQKDIQVVEDDHVDQLLLTLMLLGSVERSMPRCPEQSSSARSLDINAIGSRFWSNQSHHKGATGILKLRKLRHPTASSPLDAVVRRQITQTLILSGRKPPSWFLGKTNKDTCPAQCLDNLMLRTTHLRASSLFLIGTVNQNDYRGCCSIAMSTAEDIIVEALKLEDDFAAWPSNLPWEWQYTVARLDSVSYAMTDPVGTDLVHSYSSFRHAAAWNNYRATRLIVNNIALRACRLTESRGTRYLRDEMEKRVCGNIDVLARDLCGGIQSIFGHASPADYDILPKMASLLAWPLTVAYGIETIPYLEKAWLSSKLQTVADVLGDEMLQSIIDCGEFKF